MEQSNDNTPIKDYQTPLSRRKRFFDKSDSDGFYLETLDGGYKMQNRFCALQENKILTNYFFLQRDGEKFLANLISLHADGTLFFLQLIKGEIWENYQVIERYTINSEFLDVDQTAKTISEQFNNIFNNFFNNTIKTF